MQIIVKYWNARDARTRSRFSRYLSTLKNCIEVGNQVVAQKIRAIRRRITVAIHDNKNHELKTVIQKREIKKNITKEKEIMRRRKITKENQVNGMSVNADANHPVFVDPVIEYQKRLSYMNERHAQTFVMQCEARFPKTTVADTSNIAISNTMRKFRQKMKREKIDVQTGWTREIKNSRNQHYHIGIICNGTKVQDSRRIGSWMNEIWAREVSADPTSNLVHLCRANPTRDENAPLKTGIRIRRNADDERPQMEDAGNWLSYQCKCSQKDRTPKHHREFSFSRLPKRTPKTDNSDQERA